MSRIVAVDWLGRGGIAQCSEAWAIELEATGHKVNVVTRAGRELSAIAGVVTGPTEQGSALRSHMALCRYAASTILELQPDIVVIQNYVIPALEDVVHRAARSVGASVVFVVHDHRHHEWREGGHVGLRRQIARATHVVAHSAVVADGVIDKWRRREIEVIPLPVPFAMIDRIGQSVFHQVDDQLLAAQVGVLNRRYKGTDTVISLAERGVPGWTFALAGSGAPSSPAVESVDAFLDAGDLVASVQASDVMLLPYVHATQSAVVVLSQMCGTVAVASAVDGIREQIDDGVTGLLIAPGSSVDVWADKLQELSDRSLRVRMATAGAASVRRQHEQFQAGICSIIDRC